VKGLKRLLPFLKPYTGTIVFTLVLGLIVNGLGLATAKLLQMIVDKILVAKEHEWLFKAPLIIVGLMAVNGICRFFHIFLLRYTGEKVAIAIRTRIHGKILSLGLDFHSQAQGGALISRTMNDVNTIQQGMSLFADVVKEPINIVMIIGYLFYVDWKLTLASMALVPIVAFASDRLGRSVRKYSFRMQESFEDFTSALKETIDGIRVIKAFNLEKKLAGRVNFINTRYLQIRKKILSREEASGPLFEFIAAILAAGILIYTGSEVITGRLTAGAVMSFFYALGLIQIPIKKLQDANVRLQHTVASTDRIFQILEMPDHLAEPTHPKLFPEAWQEIEFREVSFSYGARSILDHFNLKIRRGEVVAIVGQSGAGKSTLVNLIPRFYDVTAGSIRIGGVDVREMSLKDLRDHVGLVTQDVFLFNESIEDNIRAGREEHGRETEGGQQGPGAVERAARAAHAFDFIQRTAKGFKTLTGDRGLNLSGGERQRISIARAVYKNAPILILDEATSSLDSESEKEVQRALDELMEGRTTFVIAHRLSTVQRADRILVMREGRVVEQGTHQQLLDQGGEYRKLYALQFS